MQTIAEVLLVLLISGATASAQSLSYRGTNGEAETVISGFFSICNERSSSADVSGFDVSESCSSGDLDSTAALTQGALNPWGFDIAGATAAVHPGASTTVVAQASVDSQVFLDVDVPLTLQITTVYEALEVPQGNGGPTFSVRVERENPFAPPLLVESRSNIAGTEVFEVDLTPNISDWLVRITSSSSAAGAIGDAESGDSWTEFNVSVRIVPEPGTTLLLGTGLLTTALCAGGGTRRTRQTDR